VICLRITLAAPGAGHAGLVDPADHGHLGVDVGEGALTRPKLTEVVQLAVDRLPADLVALDRLMRRPARSPSLAIVIALLGAL
jgi:hypothetical protein